MMLIAGVRLVSHCVSGELPTHTAGLTRAAKQAVPTVFPQFLFVNGGHNKRFVSNIQIRRQKE